MTPCGQGKGFSTCASFEDGRARNLNTLKAVKAAPNTCPVCDKKNDYDGNTIRMVKRTTLGSRWGYGPGKTSSGVDLVVAQKKGLLVRKSRTAAGCIVM